MNKFFDNQILRRVLLVGLILFAFFLRVYALDKFPSGFNADEAAIGYNAYSIIKTGKDEYGEILPLSFKSFGDYKPGLYFYFALPFVATIGLNEWAIRLPSAILGTGLVVLIYLLAKEIIADRRIAFFSALFLAINPWAIQFSRGGWETNAATFFITLGTYFFVKSIRQYKYLFFSFLSFLISMYLYQSPRLVVPVFVAALALIFRKELFKEVKKQTRKSAVLLVLLITLSIPLMLQFVGGGGSARFTGLSFLSDPGPQNRVNELRGEHGNAGSNQAKMFHNKLSAYGPNFLGHYLDHFSGQFLFIKGDPIIRNNIPNVGQFFYIQVIFLAVGIFSLLSFSSKLKYILVIWILVAPLASSMTYQTPNAVRALSMVIPLTILISLGFVEILRLFKNQRIKLVAGLLLISILSFEFVHYLESYYVHAPKRYPLAWEYGFAEMVQKLNQYEGSAKKVVITDRYDQPYILTLFYKKYDPWKYQPQATLSERDKFNFGTVRSFDKYEFHKITPEEIKNASNTLFVATPEEIGQEPGEFDSVSFPNGQKAFVFIMR